MDIRNLKRASLVWGRWIGFCMLLVALAGCGTNTGNTAGSESPGQPASSQAAESPNGSAASPEPAQLEKNELKIGLPLQASTFLPLYLADTKGFFEEEGLKVELFEFRGDAEVVQALAGSSVDINVASLIGMVHAINGNQPFIGFWGGFNQADFEWYSPDLTSLEEAKGARFGVTTYGSITDHLTRYAVRKAGLDPDKDVGILQVGATANGMAALDSGQISAYPFTTPNNIFAAEKGYHLLFSQREQIAETWPQHIVYAQKKFIDENPETIKAFLRAMVKGIAYIESNEAEAIQELMDRRKFEEEHARINVERIAPYFDKTGHFDPEGLQVFWEIAIESGEAEEAWSEDKWFDQRFVKSADQWLN